MIEHTETTISECLHRVPSSVIDYSAALDRLDGDVELLAEIAKLFLQDSTQQLANIRAALQMSDSSALQIATHRLKGAVANFEADEALQAVMQLEELARTGDLTRAGLVYFTLEPALQRLNSALTLVACR
jgi:two-component system, sensor histidine kinase and response regulator